MATRGFRNLGNQVGKCLGQGFSKAVKACPCENPSSSSNERKVLWQCSLISACTLWGGILSLAPFYGWESQGTNEAAFPKVPLRASAQARNRPYCFWLPVPPLITRKFLSSMAQPTGSNNKSKLLQRSSPFFHCLTQKKFNFQNTGLAFHQKGFVFHYSSVFWFFFSLSLFLKAKHSITLFNMGFLGQERCNYRYPINLHYSYHKYTSVFFILLFLWLKMAPLANLKMLSRIKNSESNPVVLTSEKKHVFLKIVTFLGLCPKQ